MNWSRWHELQSCHDAKIPSGFGAYCIATTRKIVRANGTTDPDGILHVGESKYLRNRILAFLSCARDPRVGTHSAGWHYTHFGLNEVFPIETLRVRWVKAHSKNEAYELEGRFLGDYINFYHELPPLNFKFNWSRWEHWLRKWKKLKPTTRGTVINEHPC